jgi:hypothetical protein
VARRALDVDGERWLVYLSGRTTSYGRDEMTVVFELGAEPHRRRRVTRFSPVGTRRWEVALGEMSEARLREMFRHSQPDRTSPELRYGRETA